MSFTSRIPHCMAYFIIFNCWVLLLIKRHNILITHLLINICVVASFVVVGHKYSVNMWIRVLCVYVLKFFHMLIRSQIVGSCGNRIFSFLLLCIFRGVIERRLLHSYYTASPSGSGELESSGALIWSHCCLSSFVFVSNNVDNWVFIVRWSKGYCNIREEEFLFLRILGKSDVPFHLTNQPCSCLLLGQETGLSNLSEWGQETEPNPIVIWMWNVLQ